MKKLIPVFLFAATLFGFSTGHVALADTTTMTTATPIVTTTTTTVPVSATTTLVLGDFCPAIHFYWQKGDRGEEVRQIQMFLNVYEKNNLTVDGIYGVDTFDAVRAFQVKYADQILAPWGLDKSQATGNWYKTTSKLANYLVGCDVGAKKLENGKTVTTYTTAPMKHETTVSKKFTDFIIDKYIAQQKETSRARIERMIRDGIVRDASISEMTSMQPKSAMTTPAKSSSSTSSVANIPVGKTVPLPTK